MDYKSKCKFEGTSWGSKQGKLLSMRIFVSSLSVIYPHGEDLYHSKIEISSIKIVLVQNCNQSE